MTSTIYHVSVSKQLLLDAIVELGAGVVLAGWTDTDEAAYAAVDADPRSAFVLDATCDDRGADGTCRGHHSQP